MSKSSELFDRALKVMPGGVNSPVRAFKSVGGNPPIIESAKGAYLTDVDGNSYIDCIGSWGPMILGHSHPEVTARLKDTVESGTSFGTPNPHEEVLARLITQRVPSVEKVRFVNSGTEATMSAIRLGRAATNREVIIKFNGCYHGHADAFLIKAGSGVATLGLPNSPGVTEGAAKDTRIAEYNDLESVKRIFETEPGNVAAIIVEPVAGNMGVVTPEKGFLEGLRKLCDDYSALLILDEVMTGFRVAHGGAQELYGIKPDLTTFGKIIGGGLPVGAYGGAAKYMDMVAPMGPVYQAGTLSGNPLAMVAGIETLNRLDQEAYATLESNCASLQAGLTEKLENAGFPFVIQRVGSMLTLFFHQGPVRNMDDASAADHDMFSQFFGKMLNNGVHLPPSGYEAWFISLAHTIDIIDSIVDAAGRSLN